MNSDDFRRRTDRAREVPLEWVLLYRGATRDPRDRSKWHTEQGPISICGPKFTNWHSQGGGGGAIDLVMHLADVGCRAAVEWIERHLIAGHSTAGGATSRPSSGAEISPTPHVPRQLSLPKRDDRLLDRIEVYLTGRRHLDASIVQELIAAGRLYADQRGNAVFVLVAGKENRPVGAELRGTGSSVWRGMAAGSCKDKGYFWAGTRGSRKIVLCESAIDSISCWQMYPDRICISTSGVRSNPRWLSGLIVRGYDIYCGFDTDAAGEAAASRMIELYPHVGRLRPPAHDWNDALRNDP